MVFKVIGTDTDRSNIYDSLLTFHSSHEPVWCHFLDKWRFQSKISISGAFNSPVKRFPAILYWRVGSKTRIMDGAIRWERILISLVKTDTLLKNAEVWRFIEIRWTAGDLYEAVSVDRIWITDSYQQDSVVSQPFRVLLYNKSCFNFHIRVLCFMPPPR